GISLPTFLAVTVSLSLWLVYGIIVNSIAMIVSNILTLAFIIAITLGVYRIRSKRPEDELNKPTSSSE
ncbi:MAG: SemiSWEET family transporter, partial [Candidatus Thermoplasmatota archaeon]|nr:SemiSWEET family transporter [Candidatus Thermoplasmatota archaeon]